MSLCRRYVWHFRQYGTHVVGIDSGDGFRRPVGRDVNFVRALEFAFGPDEGPTLGSVPLTFRVRILRNSRHGYLLTSVLNRHQLRSPVAFGGGHIRRLLVDSFLNRVSKRERG